jgi:hypothetical protein
MRLANVLCRYVKFADEVNLQSVQREPLTP